MVEVGGFDLAEVVVFLLISCVADQEMVENANQTGVVVGLADKSVQSRGQEDFAWCEVGCQSVVVLLHQSIVIRVRLKEL